MGLIVSRKKPSFLHDLLRSLWIHKHIAVGVPLRCLTLRLRWGRGKTDSHGAPGDRIPRRLVGFLFQRIACCNSRSLLLLLDHVGQFVHHQVSAGVSSGLEPAGAEEDVPSHGIGIGTEGRSSHRSLLAGMDPDVARVCF